MKWAQSLLMLLLSYIIMPSNGIEAQSRVNSRMTPLQVKMHHDKIRLQDKAISKEQFEQSLKESTARTTNSGSALFGANQNIFQSDLAKDSAKLISLNKRKHIQKEKMIDMITELNEEDFNMFEEKMNSFYTYIQLSK